MKILSRLPVLLALSMPFISTGCNNSNEKNNLPIRPIRQEQEKLTWIDPASIEPLVSHIKDKNPQKLTLTESEKLRKFFFDNYENSRLDLVDFNNARKDFYSSYLFIEEFESTYDNSKIVNNIEKTIFLLSDATENVTNNNHDTFSEKWRTLRKEFPDRNIEKIKDCNLSKKDLVFMFLPQDAAQFDLEVMKRTLSSLRKKLINNEIKNKEGIYREIIGRVDFAFSNYNLSHKLQYNIPSLYFEYDSFVHKGTINLLMKVTGFKIKTPK